MARSVHSVLSSAYVQATYVSRAEAEHILEAFCWAQQGGLPQVLQEHDALVGAFVAASTPQGARLIQVVHSKPVCDPPGSLNLQATVLTCTDGCNEFEFTLAEDQLLDQLPPTDEAPEAAEATDDSLLSLLPVAADEQQRHISHHSWQQAVQQLQQSADTSDMPLYMSPQQVFTTMLRLTWFSQMHTRLQPVQQLLAAHNVPLTVLHRLGSALQLRNGTHAAAQQQLNSPSLAGAQQEKHMQQQQLGQLAALRAVVPQLSDNALQTLLQQLRALQSLSIQITPEHLQQMHSRVTEWPWRQLLEDAGAAGGEHVQMHTAATSATGATAAVADTSAAALPDVDHGSASQGVMGLADAPAGPEIDMADAAVSPACASPAAGSSKRSAAESPAEADVSKKQRLDSPPSPPPPPPPPPPAKEAELFSERPIGGGIRDDAGAIAAVDTATLSIDPQADGEQQPISRVSTAHAAVDAAAPPEVAASNVEDLSGAATFHQKPAFTRPLSGVAARRAPLAQPICIKLAVDQLAGAADVGKDHDTGAAAGDSAAAVAELPAGGEAGAGPRLQEQASLPAEQQQQPNQGPSCMAGQPPSEGAPDVEQEPAAAGTAEPLEQPMQPVGQQQSNRGQNMLCSSTTHAPTADVRTAASTVKQKSLANPSTPQASIGKPQEAAGANAAGTRSSAEVDLLVLFDCINSVLSSMKGTQRPEVQQDQVGTLIDLLWYLEIVAKPEPQDHKQSKGPRQVVTLENLKRFPKVFRLEKQHDSSRDAAVVYFGLQSGAREWIKKQLIPGRRFQALLKDYKERLKVAIATAAQADARHRVQGLTLAQAQKEVKKLWLYTQLYSGFVSFAKEVLNDEFEVTSDHEGQEPMLICRHPTATPALASPRQEPEQHEHSSRTDLQHLQQQVQWSEQEQVAVQHDRQQLHQQQQPAADTSIIPHAAVAPEQHKLKDIQLRDQLLADEEFIKLLNQFKDNLKCHLMKVLETDGVQGVDLGTAGNPLSKAQVMTPKLNHYRHQFSSMTAFVRHFLSDEFVVVKTATGSMIMWQPKGHAANVDRQPAPLSLPQTNQPAGKTAAEQQQPLQPRLQAVQVQQHGIRHEQLPARDCPVHHVPKFNASAHADDKPSQAASVFNRLGPSSKAEVPVSPPAAAPDPLPPAAATASAASADKPPKSSVFSRVSTHIHFNDVPAAAAGAAAADLRHSARDETSNPPAILKRLSAAADVSTQPADRVDGPQSMSLPPTITQEIANRLDLALIQVLLQHMRQIKSAGTSGQAQPLEEGELASEPEEQPVDGTTAEDQQLIRALPHHRMPGHELATAMLRFMPTTDHGDAQSAWLRYMLYHEVCHWRKSGGSGSGAGDPGLVQLEVPKMVERLLKHKILKTVLDKVEEVLIDKMRIGARYSNQVNVPRLEVEAANEVLRDKVPQLRPYLLLPGFLPALVRNTQLTISFMIGHSLSAALSTSNLVFVELRPVGAKKHGLDLRLCSEFKHSGHCKRGDACWFSHVKLNA